ncbi:hypothetical protein [Cellulosilyticum lentocellum]|uniref:Uncharacterized protein n=1 Tax=Cellulosilyticum lentocellum (strain ATCC 49066 / DSM 5427 / NCIMB 11756 / RHM5) TaxID=642492 RepID=F2JKJ1_CELLD|nr:hypothetical protein [Cellulosilyticum lentocellum]ADZ82151.1 hypothetical protein Clole_0408 [Cellulosilyticum lentocellum DSM 5427]
MVEKDRRVIFTVYPISIKIKAKESCRDVFAGFLGFIFIWGDVFTNEIVKF